MGTLGSKKQTKMSASEILVVETK